MDLDLTGRMVGVTMTDRDLKSVMGLHPEFPLRRAGIYQPFGKVLGHTPVGFFLEVYWIGKPKPPGGEFDWPRGAQVPAYLVQWRWVITMTLHPDNSDAEAWLRRQIEGLGLEEPPS